MSLNLLMREKDKNLINFRILPSAYLPVFSANNTMLKQTVSKRQEMLMGGQVARGCPFAFHSWWVQFKWAVTLKESLSVATVGRSMWKAGQRARENVKKIPNSRETQTSANLESEITDLAICHDLKNLLLIFPNLKMRKLKSEVVGSERALSGVPSLHRVSGAWL